MNTLRNSPAKTKPIVIVIAGWFWVAFSIAVLFVFAGIRLFEMTESSSVNLNFSRRYAEHPYVSLLHMVPGLLFAILAPLQFIRKIRREYPALHRLNGRVLVLLATVCGLNAFVAALQFPAYGGVGTLLATIVFGSWFFIALWQGVVHARRRQFNAHREWMIRVFAIALGVATIRAVIGLGQGFFGYSLEEMFSFAFWSGFAINAAVAEWWIRYSRSKQQTTKPEYSAG